MINLGSYLQFGHIFKNGPKLFAIGWKVEEQYFHFSLFWECEQIENTFQYQATFTQPNDKNKIGNHFKQDCLSLT